VTRSRMKRMVLGNTSIATAVSRLTAWS
jgi:hypothetical protein